MDVPAETTPLELTPSQAVALPVGDRHRECARKVRQLLLSSGLRVGLGGHRGTVGWRVRSSGRRRMPYFFAAGDRKTGGHTITIRRGFQKDRRTVGVGEFGSALEEEIRTRGIS